MQLLRSIFLIVSVLYGVLWFGLGERTTTSRVKKSELFKSLTLDRNYFASYIEEYSTDGMFRNEIQVCMRSNDKILYQMDTGGSYVVELLPIALDQDNRSSLLIVTQGAGRFYRAKILNIHSGSHKVEVAFDKVGESLGFTPLPDVTQTKSGLKITLSLYKKNSKNIVASDYLWNPRKQTFEAVHG